MLETIKHIIRTIMLGLGITSILSCTNNSSNEEQAALPESSATSDSTETDEVKVGVTQLTYDDFRLNIYDLEESPSIFRYRGDNPAIIDFYATWCGPCRMMAKSLLKASEKYADKVDFYKVNVEEEDKLAAAFGVQMLPTLMVIPVDGEPFFTQGAMTARELKLLIEDELLKKK